MQEYFEQLAEGANGLIEGDEVLTLGFSGEDSEFVRFNASAVRQAGSVSQRELSLDLIEGLKHCSGSVTLSGDYEEDLARAKRLVGELREKRAFLPEDPHLLYATEVQSTTLRNPGELPSGDDAIGEVQRAGEGRDLVGIYAAGAIFEGFANSLGQRNWYESASYNLDWSFYHQADKAVKSSYAGTRWDAQAFSRKVDWASEQLGALRHGGHSIEPGRYRVFLAPAALYDLVGILSWGGFGLKSHKTKQTPFLKMIADGQTLSSKVSILENTAEGVAPNFQAEGFIRPERVTLIEEGQYKDCLVSPRSAKEYGVPTNGAGQWETPESVEVSAGGLSQDDILAQLGTGIYISNVWYLNWSDRSSCRTTGMTRFATFWVENGEIKAPLNVMRFDETAYRVLGENLVDLTSEREMILDADTYFRRSTGSGRVPGALVEDFTFTL